MARNHFFFRLPDSRSDLQVNCYSHYLHRSDFGEQLSNYLISLLYQVLVLIVGWLFYHYVEPTAHFCSQKTKTKSKR